MNGKALTGIFVCVTLLLFAAVSLAAPVPDTGQTKCYDVAGNAITCPSPRQAICDIDTSYAINPTAGNTIQGSVMQIHDVEDTLKTLYEIQIWPDPLAVIDSITIQGPDGKNLPYTKDNFSRWTSNYLIYFLFVNGAPTLGTYTFTVNSGSITATDQDTQNVNRVIPIPVIISPATNAIISSNSPVFQWNQVSSIGTDIYYKLVIYDMAGYQIFATSRTLGMLSYAVPNVLKSGQTYYFQIRAGDSSEWLQEENQGRSEYRPFTMGATSVLSVNPTSRNVIKEAGTTTFSVSNTGMGTMPWTAAVTSGGSWLSITSGASGNDAGTITCSFTENTSTSARTATIRVTASGAAGSPVDVTVTQVPTVCMATLDGNLSLHIPYLSYGNGVLSLWTDFAYEFNPTYPTLIPFKLTNYGILNNPSFSCAASTLSDDFKIHIPDILLPGGSTHIWVDLEYSQALSIGGNFYWVVSNYGIL